ATRARARIAARNLLLLMLSSALRDAGNRLAARALVLLLRHVAERDDAHQALVAVYHRQAPHLDVAHVLRHVLEVVVIEHVLYLRRHDLAHRRVGALALGHRADRDVPVGDHAHQAIVLAHRHRAGVDVRHDFRYVADALPGSGNAHLARHRFADSHGNLLVTGGPWFQARDRPLP